MNETIVRKSKFFMPWQDNLQEKWLEELSRQGLHLKSINWSEGEFVLGQPQHYVYRLDFQDTLKQNKAEYLRFFSDSGWEYLGELEEWQYFRKLAQPGEETEIYTDPGTKIQKYRRYLANLGKLWLSFAVFFVPLTIIFPLPKELIWLIVGLFVLGSLYLIVIAVKVLKRISQLKSLL
jgi:hypothetical protein